MDHLTWLVISPLTTSLECGSREKDGRKLFLHFPSARSVRADQLQCTATVSQQSGLVSLYRGSEPLIPFLLSLKVDELNLDLGTLRNGTSFRQAAQELLYEPLGLPKDTIETFRTPPMDENLAEIVAKLPDGSFVSLPTPFDTPQHEGVPPEGQSVLGNAPFWSSIRTFTQALRCLLNKSAPSPGGKPLISEKLFNEAIGDGFKRRGISINQNPFMKSTDNNLSTDIDWWSKPCEGQDETLGWNMLQQCYHRAEVCLVQRA